MVLTRSSLAIRKSDFVKNKLHKMIYYTFGLTFAISIRATIPNLYNLLTQCFTNTTIQFDVMFICRTSLGVPLTITTSVVCNYWNQISAKTNGSLGAEQFKSFLSQYWLSFSLEKVDDWVIRVLQ
ncbi:hypothetical protein EAE96_010099 [Botrytis aclada]|nr:hypothetical protein EAE96_010099 [Botrytis aclada]